MTELFGRKVYVVIGKRGEVGKRFDGFRVNFDVKMSTEKFPDKATIQIYNIQKSAELFLGEKGLIIQVFAGYDEPSVIYTGEIEVSKKKKTRKKKSGAVKKDRAVSTKNSGVDFITTFQCRSGGESYSNSRLNKLWEKEVSLTTVLYDIAEAVGITLEIPSNVPKVMVPAGFTAFGPAVETFDKVVDMLGFGWFVQLDKFIVVPKGEGKGKKAFQYSYGKGLVGEPQQTNRGVNITVLLNSELFPGEIIELNTPSNKGWYLIERVQHKGDSGWSNDFFTICQCKSLGTSTSTNKAGLNSNRNYDDSGDTSNPDSRELSFDDWATLDGSDRGLLLQKEIQEGIIDSQSTETGLVVTQEPSFIDYLEDRLKQENLFGI